jgi:hypothetical protein
MSRPTDDPPQIDTPIIDIQDLEHKPSPSTRVSNKGVKIEPTIDELPEDEEARESIAEFEELLERRPPG